MRGGVAKQLQILGDEKGRGERACSWSASQRSPAGMPSVTGAVHCTHMVPTRTMFPEWALTGLPVAWSMRGSRLLMVT